ncbi:MAG: hypothetical protein H0W01_07980 [Pseudonocardiales bacterium]|nr:hypothetical protein [Pseudonocardiales bacterium]
MASITEPPPEQVGAELAADPEVAAGQRDIAGDFLGMTKHRQPVPDVTIKQRITHRSPNDQETQMSTAPSAPSVA